MEFKLFKITFILYGKTFLTSWENCANVFFCWEFVSFGNSPTKFTSSNKEFIELDSIFIRRLLSQYYYYCHDYKIADNNESKVRQERGFVYDYLMYQYEFYIVSGSTACRESVVLTCQSVSRGPCLRYGGCWSRRKTLFWKRVPAVSRRPVLKMWMSYVPPTKTWSSPMWPSRKWSIRKLLIITNTRPQ